MRLNAQSILPHGVARPGYTPADYGVGIVHLGLGAFHKAHQAAYTDTALAHSGGDWRIAGVSLRSPEPAAQLAPQDGLFTLIERSTEGSTARVIGAIAKAYCLDPDRAAVLDALTAPTTRIVSITVTEKGYGIDRSTGGVNPAHPAIAQDLATPDAPVGVAGLLVWALNARRSANVPPFTVLCCDNLPDNGAMLRGLLLDFARRALPEIADHIASDVAFPATMVDRITPATTDATLAAAAQMTGHEDAAAIETEAFSQWVIEDHFPTGRPDWESGGAMFVADVKPYEEMKLRMLNGAHSMLAYAGFLVGCTHVSDVMADPVLNPLVGRHLAAAAATLPQLDRVNFADYADALITRFSNPHLHHQTYQIAMDGTEKLPQRILAPALDALEAGQPMAPFAFAVAAWMRYTLGRTEAGETYALRDPREDELTRLTHEQEDGEVVANLVALPGLFPSALAKDSVFLQMVSARLGIMMHQGMRRAMDSE